MFTRILFARILPAVAVFFWAVSAASAQHWAEKLFTTRSHDFGTVARNAKAEFTFPMKNIYVEDVHVASVRSSCGCTTPRIETTLLKTYQEGGITAQVNTDRFLGRKGATITVTIDQPKRAEVQLHVRVNICNDVIVEPGSVRLGDVAHGQPAEQSVRVRFSGYRRARITGATAANPHLSARVVPENSGYGTAYRLHVRLDEAAPPGYLADHVMLHTSGYRVGQVPVLVEGRVLPSVSISPSALFLGAVKPGQKVQKQLVVRAARPFRIKGISAEGSQFEFDPADGEDLKPLHLVPVTFVAGDVPGAVRGTIRIETDLDDGSAVLPASGVVVAASQ